MFKRQAKGSLSPLHRAVIAGDEKAVGKLVEDDALREARDGLGFTPLELAQLLGQRRCQQLLEGAFPAVIKVLYKESTHIAESVVADFERFFSVTYRPFLTFSSYRTLREVVGNCPFLLRCRWLVSENYDWGEQYKGKLATGALADLSVRWIDDLLGYGVFAESDIPQGAFIGEYTGSVRRLYRRHPDQNAYCFRYPTKLWSLHYFAIDALKEGNLLRFVNHSDRPNLLPLCAVDRGLLHQVFVASQSIPKDTQLTFDYGPDYWQCRAKL